MAVRGRKSKPPELKILTGNPGRRPVQESVAPFEGAVTPPTWIDEKSKDYRLDFLAEWERITKQLTAWDVIGNVNQGALEAVCALYAQGVKAAKDGDATEVRQSFDTYRKALNEFGLTPASKGRVSVGAREKAKSKAAGYFGN